MVAKAHKRLTNAPVAHVLVQTSFSPVLDIGDSIPALQAGLRALGFVKLKIGQLQQFNVQGATPGKLDARPYWDFANADDSLSLVVGNDFVTLQTSQYEHFPSFSRALRGVLDVLARTTSLTWATRVGLRYINLIRLKGGEGYAEWLQRELLAFPFDNIHDALTGPPQFATQSMATTEFGTLLIRSYQLPVGQFVPPDLAVSSSLTYRTPSGAPSGSVALDIDHFTQLNEQFEPQMIIRVANQLHDLIKVAFRAAITDQAFEQWGPEEVVRAE